jgi:transcriptional regulator with XRE-family HTH domain
MDLKNVNIVDVKMNLANMLRSLRKRNSMTRAELAEELGVSRITIQNIETAQNVNIDTLLKVLQYFELLENFNDFISEERSNNAYGSLY